MSTAAELRCAVTTTLDGQDGYWDIDALVAELWGAGYRDLDEVDESMFWEVVARHEVDPADPAEVFRVELSAAIARQSRGDRDAIWTDGVVTVRARGVSRVNQRLPQPLASFRIATAVDTIDLRDGDEVTWPVLWGHVQTARTQADTTADVMREALRSASAAARKADQAATDARHRRDAAVRAAVNVGIPVADVAQVAGISAPAVYKITGGK